MFIEENSKIKVVDEKGRAYTGTVYKIVLQLCEENNNKPHALLFLSQDKNCIEQEGDFGCISLWVNKLRSMTLI